MRRDLLWVAGGAALAGLAYLAYGVDGALLYLAVYTLSVAISLDGLLMLALVVNAAPSVTRASIVRWSLLCSVGLRITVPIVAAVLLHVVPDTIYLLGAYLLYDALRAQRLDPFERTRLRSASTVRSIAILELWYATDLLAGVAATDCLPILIVAGLAATLAVRRMFATALLWAPRLVQQRTATFTLVGLAGCALAQHGLTAPPWLALCIVAGVLVTGVIARTETH